MENLRKQLMELGLDEKIIESMLKVTKVAKKKAIKRKSISRAKKQPRLVNVTLTCSTCGAVKLTKKMVNATEENPELDCTTRLCTNCIQEYRKLSIDTLISLIVIQNHRDIELRSLGLRTQTALAKKRSPEEWFAMNMNHVIFTPDEEETNEENN